MPIELEQREWREERALPHDIARRQLLLALHPHQPERPDRMNHTPEALQLANQLEANYAHVYAGLAPAAAAALRSQHARIADLEAQLYAVGAGGVGESIKPKVQADTAQEPGTGIPASVPTGWKLVPVEPTDDMFIEGMEADCRGRPSIDDDNHVRSIWRAMLSSAPDAPPPPAAPQEPVAWMYEWNGRTHITTADQRPIEHAHPHFNKSKPLYTAPNPARQPLTDEQILSIVRVAPALDTAEAEFLHIVRAVEFAHGITGEQQ